MSKLHFRFVQTTKNSKECSTQILTRGFLISNANSERCAFIPLIIHKSAKMNSKFLFAVDSRKVAIDHYSNLPRGVRGNYLETRISHGLPTFFTRNFLAMNEKGRVDRHIGPCMIDYSHLVGCSNMHSQDTVILPKFLTDSDKVDCVIIQTQLKKESNHLQRQFIKTNLMKTFGSDLDWERVREQVNGDMEKYIREDNVEGMIEVRQNIYFILFQRKNTNFTSYFTTIDCKQSV